jgi:hypothetical protein
VQSSHDLCFAGQADEVKGVPFPVFEEDLVIARHAEGVPLAVHLNAPEELVVSAVEPQDTLACFAGRSAVVAAED